MEKFRQMSGQIFISYRRGDSKAWAGRLSDHLSNRFPSYRIFMDVDSIEPGEDFVQTIERTVGACDVLIAVVGKDWLAASNQGGQRRLDNPEDLVRTEIATALKRNIRVIPVLVDGASMPHSSDLPDDLKALARRNALQLSHDRFRSDSALLESAVERILENTAEYREGGEKKWLPPATPAAKPQARKPSGEVSKVVFSAPPMSDESRRRKPLLGSSGRPREPNPAKLLIGFLLVAVFLAVGGLIYLATRPLQSQPPASPVVVSSPSEIIKATPAVAVKSSSEADVAPSPVHSGGGSANSSMLAPNPPALTTATPAASPKSGMAKSLGGEMMAMLDSVKILNDGRKSLEIFITFENRSAAEVAVYIGNPMRQNGPPFQVLAVSVTDSSGMPYELQVLEGVTTLADGSVDPHRIYNGLNRYVSVPPKGDAQVRFVLWPSRAPLEPPTSIDFTAELRLLTDVKNKQMFDRSLRFPSIGIGTFRQAESEEGNVADATANRLENRDAKSLGADLTATLDSVKVLNDGTRSLELYVDFENHSGTEIAVYVGNPMRQNGPPFQTLAASLTDSSEIPYELRSLEGVTTLAEGSVDAHRIYNGLNRYVIVPGKGDARIRLLFWPSRVPSEPPTSIDFTAELRLLTDVKNKQMFDRTLRFPSFKIDPVSNAAASTETVKSGKSNSLGADITARLDSARGLNDAMKSLEIYVTFENSSANEVAVYMSNPMRQNGPPFQALAASLTDSSGMPYELHALEGVTTLAENSLDPHRIYNGLNRFVIVPPKSDAQVRLLFWPSRRPPGPPSSIDFTAELRLLTDVKNRQFFDRTLNVLNYQAN